MVPTTGSLIWLSFVPLLRIALTIVCGFILAKKGLFPLAASKGFSQVVSVRSPALSCHIFVFFSQLSNRENETRVGNEEDKGDRARELYSLPPTVSSLHPEPFLLLSCSGAQV